MRRVNPKTLRTHPESGCVPEMPADEFRAFLADVRENGIRTPIEVLPGTGTVVDGRTRLKAATAAGLPDVPVVDAELRSGEGPAEYMLRAAALRRHLNSSQRGMIANQIARLKSGQKAGASKEAAAKSQSEAARDLNVGRATVQRAKTVQEKGTKEEIDQVNAGRVPVSRAEAEIRRKEREVREAAREDPARFAPLATKLDLGVKPADVHKQFVKEKEKAPAPQVTDATGFAVPDRLKAVFADRSPAELAAGLEAMAVDGLAALRRRVDQMAATHPALPAADIGRALDRARAELQAARELAEGGRPHAVHRRCAGDGCRDCRRAGYVTRRQHAELARAGRL